MRRYVISPIIGTGMGEEPYRAEVADYGQSSTNTLIPSVNDPDAPNFGAPKYNFAPCLVASADWASILTISNLFAFPVYEFDARMDGMDATVRSEMKSNIEAYDWDGLGMYLDASNVDSESYGEVINRICRQIEPAFPGVHRFSVGEPTV